MGVSVWTGQHVAGGAGAGDRPGRSRGRQDGRRRTELGLRSKGGVTPEDPESEERPVPFVGGEPLREAFPATKPRTSWVVETGLSAGRRLGSGPRPSFSGRLHHFSLV